MVRETEVVVGMEVKMQVMVAVAAVVMVTAFAVMAEAMM